MTTHDLLLVCEEAREFWAPPTGAPIGPSEASCAVWLQLNRWAWKATRWEQDTYARPYRSLRDVTAEVEREWALVRGGYVG